MHYENKESTMTDLREIQLCELSILKEFVRICDAHGLTYYLSCGTLLGAVRHKGFIPWDNDIDVEMPIEDYRRFLSIAPHALSENYFLQTYCTDPGYNETWAKLKKNETTSLPIAWKSWNTHFGIGIDVFPLIGEYHNSALRWLQSRLFGIMRTLLAKEFSEAVQKEEIVSRKVRALWAIPRSGRVRLCCVLERFVFRSINRADVFVMVDHTMHHKLKREVYSSRVIMDFEDACFNCPCGYDYYLTEMYGDYMTPPPESERGVGHEIYFGKIIYDCHTSYKTYLLSEIS